MDNSRNYYRKHSKGFTLMEVIIVLAIIIVLGALGIPKLGNLSVTLKCNEMDAYARQVYMAAQSRLTIMKAAGTLESGASTTAGAVNMPSVPPIDYDEMEFGTFNSADYLYVKSGSSVASMLVPVGSVDEKLQSGTYYIEYNYATASVYSVFYSETDFDYSAVSATNRDRDILKDVSGAVVGYYGGGGSNSPEESREMAGFTVENGEALTVVVDPKADVDYELIIEARINTNDYESYTYHISDYMLSPQENVVQAGDGKVTVTIDSLETGMHFKDLFADDITTSKAAIVPGSDLKLTLKATPTTGDINVTTKVSKTVNSLFADIAGSEASLEYGRHLQNLSTPVSGVTGITAAAVTTDITWDNAKSFHPIFNDELTSFSGGGNELRALNIVPGTYASRPSCAGLFGSLGYTQEAEISNVKLVNTHVSGNTVYAGTLAGMLHNTTVAKCLAYSEGTGTSYINVSGSNSVGGLVGKSDGSNFSTCAAALNSVKASMTGTSINNVGGLIGTSTGDSVMYCYANNSAIEVSGSKLYTAGLVGNALLSELQYCYALGDIQQNGGITSGLLNSSIFENVVMYCYAAATFDNAAGTIYGVGAANNTYTTCSYVKFDGTYAADKADGTVVSRNMDALSDIYGMGIWTTATQRTTHPYASELHNHIYPMPRIVGLAHYGNWPDDVVVEQEYPVMIAYYEVYMDEALPENAGRYTIGFYNKAMGENTLQNPDEFSDGKHIVQDGYALLFRKDAGYNTCVGGVTLDQLTNPAKIKTIYVGYNGDKNYLKKISDYTYCGSKKAVNYIGSGTAFQDASTLTSTANSAFQYYCRFMPRSAYLHVHNGSIRTAFFNTFEIKVINSGVTSSYKYYYNPYAAMSQISKDVEPDAIETVHIRTIRQYCVMTDSVNRVITNADNNFSLDADLDFSNIKYSNTSFNDSLSGDYERYWKSPHKFGGYQSSDFSGEFDGKNHTLTGINIEAGMANAAYYGAFGKIDGATIKNLTVAAINVNNTHQLGIEYAGCLVGYGKNSSITNVHIVEPTIAGQCFVGGIMGVMDGGSVSNVTITGSTDKGLVSGKRIVGGAIGQLKNSSAVSINGVTVSGISVVAPGNATTEASGLNTSISINSRSEVYGTGGFIGSMSAATAGRNITINNINVSNEGYADKRVEQGDLPSEADGLKYYAASPFIGNYYTKQSTVNTSIDNIALKSIKLKAIGDGGDNDGAAYGMLFGKVFAAGRLTIGSKCSATDCSIDRTGGVAANTVYAGGYMGTVLGYSTSAKLTLKFPLQSGGFESKFSAVWNDGSSFPGTNKGGIFGCLGGNVIMDSMSIKKASVNGLGGSTGGFAGVIFDGNISNISIDEANVYSNVNTDSSYTGAFAGTISGSNISHCDTRITKCLNGAQSIEEADKLRGRGHLGGFAGKLADSSLVEHCFAAMPIHSTGGGTTDVGGFVGIMDKSTAQNCYASGDVISQSTGYAGGFVGRTETTSKASPYIRNCYAAGDVSSTTAKYAGGFVGYRETGIMMTSYSIGTVQPSSASGSKRGGFVGHSTFDDPVESMKEDTKAFFNAVKEMIVTNRADSSSKYVLVGGVWNGTDWDYSDCMLVIEYIRSKSLSVDSSSAGHELQGRPERDPVTGVVMQKKNGLVATVIADGIDERVASGELDASCIWPSWRIAYENGDVCIYLCAEDVNSSSYNGKNVDVYKCILPSNDDIETATFEMGTIGIRSGTFEGGPTYYCMSGPYRSAGEITAATCVFRKQGGHNNYADLWNTAGLSDSELDTRLNMESFNGFEAITSTHPYANSGAYPFEGLEACGRAISGYQHFGDWPE